jgi:ketosteroid isomerase-like protein
MSSPEEKEKLVTEGFDAFNSGDVATLARLFSPRIQAHVAPGLANPGNWEGFEGFSAMVATWSEAFSHEHFSVVGMIHPDEHHVIAEVHQTAVGAISGAPVEMTIFYLFEVRDGKAVRLHLYGSREAAMTAIR